MKHFKEDCGPMACSSPSNRAGINSVGNRARIAVLLLIAGLYAPLAQAQYEQVWVFGRQAGLNFNSGIPVPVQTAIIATNGESSAAVCDGSGQLLFYSEGTFVWDRNHNLMPNGADLLPGSDGESHTSSTSQGTLIVPVPDDADKYYLFSLTSMEFWGLGFGKLYYSVVDMNLNGGMGDVVPGQKGILVDSMLLEKMTAVRGDRCNIWLVTGRIVSAFESVFQAYEISASGVSSTPVVSETGLGSSVAPCGILVPSPDGTRMLATQATGFGSGNKGFSIFDFDPATGLLANPLQLLPSSGGYGAAFSADGTKAYVNETQSGIISQFDLAAGDEEAIIASRTPLGGSGFSQLKRGPDDRIYFNPQMNGENDLVGVIKSPNLAGIAADFDASFLELIPGTNLLLGLPNIVTAIQPDTIIHTSLVQAGCFASQTVLQAPDATEGWDYVWNTGGLGPDLVVNAPGTYWLSYRTPPCNLRWDTFHVRFPNGVLPDIYVDTACIGRNSGSSYATTYPGDTVHYTYVWLSGIDTLSVTDTLSSVPAGHYTLMVHTAHCDTSLNFIIPEVDYQVAFTTSDTLLCMGDILQFQNVSDNHFDTFQWYFGDGDSSIAAVPAGHVYPHAGTFEILLSGSGAICTDTARKSVIIDSFFAASFQMDQSSICVGEGIYFQLAAAHVSFTGLQWDWGDGSYLNADYDTVFYHAFDQAGTWLVQASLNARACPDTSVTDTVRVYALPEVNLGTDTSLCLDGHVVVLRNLATAPNETHHYLWNTGDTTAGLRVLQPGSYSLQIAIAPSGCNATDVIEVKKDCYTDIPNAFTPNGDGDNDYFFPRTQLGRSVSSFKMQVFNRWGQLLFETAQINGRGWDGRFNEQEQPLGVYVYLVDMMYSNGSKEHYEGNVTLVR